MATGILPRFAQGQARTNSYGYRAVGGITRPLAQFLLRCPVAAVSKGQGTGSGFLPGGRFQIALQPSAMGKATTVLVIIIINSKRILQLAIIMHLNRSENRKT